MKEDLGFIEQVKSFFTGHPHHHQLHPPKPALSEHSTSNPATSSDHPSFHSPPVPAMYQVPDVPVNTNNPEEDEEEEDEDVESDSEIVTDRNNSQITPATNTQGIGAAAAEPSELMQLEMSEDIRLGSPDDGSNNMDSDLHMLGVGQSSNPTNQRRQADSYRAESTRRWPLSRLESLLGSGIQQKPPGI